MGVGGRILKQNHCLEIFILISSIRRTKRVLGLLVPLEVFTLISTSETKDYFEYSSFRSFFFFYAELFFPAVKSIF